MGFDDLADVLGITPAKVLPIGGRQVAFPGRVSARTGMLLLSLQRDALARDGDVEATIEALGLTDEDGEELEREIFGEAAAVLDELGVIGEARQLVMGTLVAWHLGGVEAAEKTWAAGVGGKAQTPGTSNRATRRKTAGRSSKTAPTAAARSRAGSGASSAKPRRATGA
jgi:hypothetical protein